MSNTKRDSISQAKLYVKTNVAVKNINNYKQFRNIQKQIVLLAIGMQIVKNNVIVTIMQHVNPTRAPVSVIKDIREKNAKIHVRRVIMVLGVWRSVVVRMAAVVIMYRVNVFARPVILDHCKLLYESKCLKKDCMYVKIFFVYCVREKM